MSKELTPLEALHKIANVEMKEQYKASKNCLVYRVISDEYSKELNTIEKSLKEKGEIEKLYLKECRKYEKLNLEHYKKDKALEIIKREPSAVIEIITTYDTWEEYIKDYPINDKTIWHIIKNKSEFDLLKEELL